MKKHILIGLALMLACFITGGIYIVASIHEVTNKLQNIVSLHKVEFIRVNLEHHIKSVQSDLLLRGTPHQRTFDESLALAENMEEATSACLNCHHGPETTEKLVALGVRVEQYMRLLSTTLTMRASSERLEGSRLTAFRFGEGLLNNVKSLSVDSALKISGRTAQIYRDVTAAKHILITCIVVGPIAFLLLTMFFLKRFTGSVGSLVTAAQTLQSGNLDYRIEDKILKDEFLTMAEAFNNMASSLQEEQKKFESVNQLYQTLFETAGDSIMITSLDEGNDAQVLSANKAAANLYGYSKEELLGMDVSRLIPGGRDEFFLAQMRTVLSGEWTHERVPRLKKDGSQIIVDLSMGLLRLADKRYLITFCRDITEQLKSEEQFQRANQMALVGQMAAGLAHEIKNPLAGIKVSLDVLADELDLHEEDKELFARIINEINRMEKLLKSLLSYARPPEPQFDQIDINPLLENSLKNAAVATASKTDIRINIERDFAADLPRVEVDSAQIQQVFLNILLNAVDAMETDGTISAMTRMRDQDTISIEITDTGKGISEAALEKIFNPFFTTKSKGTGLGLSICKRLVEQNGGSIEVFSKPDSGTSFIINLLTVRKQPGAAA